MNIKKMMKQAQEMQKKMLEAQEKAGDITAEGTSGGGMVTATVNGKGELKALKIDPKIVDPSDIEMMEDLIIAAFNDAKEKVEAKVNEEMSSLTSGMSLPDNFKLPF